MAYRFRFATVLDYRRNLEELAQHKLTAAQAHWEKLQVRLIELEDAKERAISDFEERKREPISAPLYALLVEGLASRERAIVKQRQDLDIQREVVTRSRRELLAKVREREIMEKTRKGDYEKYLMREQAREQKEMDEQVVLRFKR